MPRFPKKIVYCEKMEDSQFEYRNIILNQEAFMRITPGRLLTVAEWRELGIQGTHGWEHYLLYSLEPNVIMLRKPRSIPIGQDSKSLDQNLEIKSESNDSKTFKTREEYFAVESNEVLVKASLVQQTSLNKQREDSVQPPKPQPSRSLFRQPKTLGHPKSSQATQVQNRMPGNQNGLQSLLPRTTHEETRKSILRRVQNIGLPLKLQFRTKTPLGKNPNQKQSIPQPGIGALPRNNSSRSCSPFSFLMGKLRRGKQ